MTQPSLTLLRLIGPIWGILLLTLLVVTPVAAQAEETPVAAGPMTEMSVATISFADQAELNRLADGLDVLSVDHASRTFVALLHASQVTRLRSQGLQLQIDLLQTARLQTPLQPLPGQSGGVPGYPCYRTVAETYADLAQLALDYPQLATWTAVGESWEKSTTQGSGGHDLYALLLTNRARTAPKPRFLLIAAIHARELTTAELATRFAERLVQQYEVDPDVTWLLDHGELHLIPQGNPDGRLLVEQGWLWRKNTNQGNGCSLFPYYGTDLNRNSSFQWDARCDGFGCASTDACNETYRGPSAASEPETQAIEAYARTIFPDQRGPSLDDPAPADSSGLFITLHSYGGQVLYPWGWSDQPAPNDSALRTLGRKFGYLNGYAVCQSGAVGCIYATTGTTDDWLYGELGVASYTFELGKTFFESCSSFAATVLPHNLDALLYAFKAARRPYQAPMGPDVVAAQAAPTRVLAGAAAQLSALVDDSRYASRGYGHEPVQAIAAARYTVNEPPWAEGASFYALAAADGSWDSSAESVWATVDTGGWEAGRHLIFLQGQDASGHWGVPSAVFLEVDPALFALRPLSVRQVAAPGTTVAHDLQLRNTGTETDTYRVDVQWPAGEAAWVTVAPQSLGPLAPGVETHFAVTVTVPLTARDGAAGHAFVTVASQLEPGQVLTTTLTTAAASLYALAVSPAALTVTAAPGATAAASLWMTNTGRIADTYTVTARAGLWPLALSPAQVILAPGEGVTVTARVTVPQRADDGAEDGGEIAIRSLGSGGPAGTVPYTARVHWRRFYLPFWQGPE